MDVHVGLQNCSYSQFTTLYIYIYIYKDLLHRDPWMCMLGYKIVPTANLQHYTHTYIYIYIYIYKDLLHRDPWMYILGYKIVPTANLQHYTYIYIYIKIYCTEIHGSTCWVTKLFLQPIYNIIHTYIYIYIYIYKDLLHRDSWKYMLGYKIVPTANLQHYHFG